MDVQSVCRGRFRLSRPLLFHCQGGAEGALALLPGLRRGVLLQGWPPPWARRRERAPDVGTHRAAPNAKTTIHPPAASYGFGQLISLHPSSLFQAENPPQMLEIGIGLPVSGVLLSFPAPLLDRFLPGPVRCNPVQISDFRGIEPRLFLTAEPIAVGLLPFMLRLLPVAFPAEQPKVAGLFARTPIGVRDDVGAVGRAYCAACPADLGEPQRVEA